MPIGDQSGLKEGVQKGLALAIPLVLQRRRLDAAEGEFNQKMMMKRLELANEGIQAKDKIQAIAIQKRFENEMEKSQMALDRDKLTQKTRQEKEELELDKLQLDQAAKQKAARLAFDKTKLNTPGQGKSPKDMTTERRMTAKDVANAEKKISEGDMAQVHFFNQYAKKPYVYIQTEGESPYNIMGLDIPFTGGDPGIKKIKLPKFQGKQVYAEDVYQTMIDNDMTFEEVLREIGAIE